jgi:glucans biosynthesis protein C
MAPQLASIQSPAPGVKEDPPTTIGKPPPMKRLEFIDNLRIFLICGVLVVHLNATYGWIGSWMYRDPTPSDPFTGTVLSILSGIGIACGMGLFFLLAGYFTPISYDHKGGASFVRNRLIRLGIPWLVYSLLLQPLVYYIAYGMPISFWRFYTLYLQRIGSIADGPIWFIELLVYFSLIYAAWRWLTRHRVQSVARTEMLPSSMAILGFIFALGLTTFAVRFWWSAGVQPKPFNVPLGYLPQYISLYVLGIVASRRNWFFKLTPRIGRNWSLITLLASLLILGGIVAPATIQEAGKAGTQQAGYTIAGGFNWLAFCYALWEAFMVIGMSIGLLALFRERWNTLSRLARSWAPSVYLVYVIHPVVLVAIAYGLHYLALYSLLKWAIAVLICIPLCFLISGWIRKIPYVSRVV